jgi:hypothetical protein
MQKANQLKDHLLAEFSQLKQRPETVTVHEDDGVIYVYQGSENNNFKMQYTVVITIYDTSIKKEQLAYVFSQWIKANYPQHEAGTLTFSAEIITATKSDITFSLPLSETIKAQDVNGDVRLARSKDSISDEAGNNLNQVDSQRDHDSGD